MLWTWTIAVCLAVVSGQKGCPDTKHRIWISSRPDYYLSDEECENSWKKHVERLRSVPGWKYVIVDTYLCGQGDETSKEDMIGDFLRDLRED